MPHTALPFAIELWLSEELPPRQRQQAQQAFAQALAQSLGDAALVLPTYQAFVAIVQAQGTGSAEGIEVENLPDAQRHVFESWRLAETQAMQAVFGLQRHMGEGLYTLRAL